MECGAEDERGGWSQTQIWDAAAQGRADTGGRRCNIALKNDHLRDVGGNIQRNKGKDRIIGLWEVMGMLLTQVDGEGTGHRDQRRRE